MKRSDAVRQKWLEKRRKIDARIASLRAQGHTITPGQRKMLLPSGY